jgi:hypothetical protein
MKLQTFLLALIILCGCFGCSRSPVKFDLMFDKHYQKRGTLDEQYLAASLKEVRGLIKL